MKLTDLRNTEKMQNNNWIIRNAIRHIIPDIMYINWLRLKPNWIHYIETLLLSLPNTWNSNYDFVV